MEKLPATMHKGSGQVRNPLCKHCCTVGIETAKGKQQMDPIDVSNIWKPERERSKQQNAEAASIHKSPCFFTYFLWRHDLRDCWHQPFRGSVAIAVTGSTRATWLVLLLHHVCSSCLGWLWPFRSTQLSSWFARPKDQPLASSCCLCLLPGGRLFAVRLPGRIVLPASTPPMLIGFTVVVSARPVAVPVSVGSL